MTEEERKEYYRKYREANKEKIAESKRKYREANRETLNNKSKVYYENNKEHYKNYREENKDKIKEVQQEYYQKNKDEIKEKTKEYAKENKEKLKETRKLWHKKKLENDPLYKITYRFSNKLRKIIKQKGYVKTDKTIDILGCTYNEFIKYLETKFEPWMSWDNYGLYNGTPNYGWDIDHIIPTSSATTEDELLKLNHYTNLQPLCSHINRNIKKDKY
jgi:hypothetical protein